MKRIFTLFILTMLLFVFVGCNSNGSKSNEELIVTTTSVSINVGEKVSIIYETKNRLTSTTVCFETNETDIISLDNNVVTGLKAGNATVKVYLSSKPEEVVSVSVTVLELKLPNFTVENMVSQLNVLESFTIKATVVNTNSKLVYETSDENIISVRNNVITGENEGTAVITISLKDHADVKQEFTIQVILDPIKVFETLIIDDVLVQDVTTFGVNPKEMNQQVLGSVCRYLFKEVEIIEQFAPIDTNKYTGQVATEEMLAEVEPMKLVRPGIKLEELKYIVYHDTGNAGVGADAKMHANYMVGSYNRGDRARSWHYTVDDNVIYYQVPNDEVTWQGDSYEAYAKSIGIETCVNYGADLYKVWQNTARLMASLLIEKGLTINDIKQHYDMSGKNCPQTLRYNNLYDYAISLIEGELIVQTLLKDYEITFESLNPEYLDNTGKVIKLPNDYRRLGYKVIFTKDNESVSKVFYSNINGSCDANKDELQLAEAFDLKVMNANLSATKECEAKIQELVDEFNSYSENVQLVIGTKDFLFSIETELLKSYDNNNDLLINEVYIDFGIMGEASYNYIELYNKSGKAFDLSGYKVIINGEEFTIKEGVINPKGNYLIAFGSGEFGSDNNTYFPMPDSAFIISITNDNLSVILKDSNNNVVDKLGINDVQEFETESFKTSDGLLSVNRRYLFDTDNNLRDFTEGERTPFNSFNETMEYVVDEDVFLFDWSVLLANKTLELSDEEEINRLLNVYDMLTSEQKLQSKKIVLLNALALEIEGLKNPNMAVINNALSQIPSRIVNDFKLPEVEGLTYEFVTEGGSEYYNIETGEYLKLSYEAKLITMVARYESDSKEFTVNFGLANPEDQIVFTTGTTKPSEGSTSDGLGTYEGQLSAVGFGGVAIRVAGKIFFIGQDCLINLDSNTLNSTLTKTELRPLGGVDFINNCAIVKGEVKEYKGTGALYYNSGYNDLTFDLSDTYGRNNAGSYGYCKVMFSKNSRGEYYVSNILPDSGTNDSTTNYQVTLKPGEYLWCPHTFETNADYGTWLVNPGSAAAGGVLEQDALLEIIHYKNS